MEETVIIDKKRIFYPPLRFKEFIAEWKIKRGSDIFLSSRTKGNESLPIYSVTLNQGMIPRDSLERLMGNDAKPSDNLFVRKGDIAYNMMRMWQGAYGLSTVDCMVSPAYVVLRPQISISSEFMIRYFARSRSLYLFTAFSYGLTSDRLRLYFKDFARIKFAVPEYKEQQKIASFLSAVDEKIHQLTRKKELLEQYKKGVMQQIFSRKLRFRDENGNDFPEWEEKRLEEIAIKKSSNLAANAIEGKDGEYKIYGASGLLKKVNFYIEEEEYISIVKDGAGVGKTLLCEAKSSVLGTLDMIKPTTDVDLYFLYSLLNNINFLKYSIGSTIPHIYFKDYSNEKIEIPCKEEQQHIATFLSSIESKISKVFQEISYTEAFKKGLLQQMFV